LATVCTIGTSNLCLEFAFHLFLLYKQNGLARKRSVSSSAQSESQSSTGQSGETIVNKKTASSSSSTIAFGGPFHPGTSLALALQNSRRSNKIRTSFVRNHSSSVGNSLSSSDVVCSSFSKSIAFNHTVFHSIGERQSQLSKTQHFTHSSNLGISLDCSMSCPSSKRKKSSMASLFEQSVGNGFLSNSNKRKKS
jgi:hypothetical protein